MLELSFAEFIFTNVMTKNNLRSYFEWNIIENFENSLYRMLRVVLDLKTQLKLTGVSHVTQGRPFYQP